MYWFRPYSQKKDKYEVESLVLQKQTMKYDTNMFAMNYVHLFFVKGS